jgi:hypothetical protein
MAAVNHWRVIGSPTLQQSASSFSSDEYLRLLLSNSNGFTLTGQTNHLPCQQEFCTKISGEIHSKCILFAHLIASGLP